MNQHSQSTAPVLLIHSTGTLPQMWDRLLAEVPLAAPLMTPANLGYPPNPPLARGMPFRLSDDLDRLRGAIPGDIAELHLVGHSYGGLLALRLARELARHGGPQPKSLWLYEPVLFGALRHDTHTRTEIRQQLDQLYVDPAFLDDETHGGREAWLETFIDYWNRSGAWAAMPKAARRQMLTLGWKMFQEVRAINLDPMPFEDYHVDAELTIVHGDSSPRIIATLVRGLARVNPQARVDTIRAVGHMAPLTHPQAVAASLRDHFRRHGIGDTPKAEN